MYNLLDQANLFYKDGFIGIIESGRFLKVARGAAVKSSAAGSESESERERKRERERERERDTWSVMFTA